MVKIIVLPLHKITKEYVENLTYCYDMIYIPHKQRSDFVNNPKCLYYMQTVFPDRFTVDSNGWGASMSWCPLTVTNADMDNYLTDHEFHTAVDDNYEMLRLRLKDNVSKFQQPKNVDKIIDENYILFVCQIPHDEVIHYHSKTSVDVALMQTLDFAQKHGIKVLVKGHPANPSAMSNLIRITEKYKCAEYRDDVSIHEALSKCKLAVMVNSGVGLEAMLHGKPIYTFGDSEYRNVVYSKVNGRMLNDVWDELENFDGTTIYKIFLYNFINNCYPAT